MIEQKVSVEAARQERRSLKTMLHTCSRIKHFGCRAHTVFASAERSYGLGPLHAQIVEIVLVKGISASVSPRIQYVLAITMERKIQLQQEKM
jgi:hypothetical protein